MLCRIVSFVGRRLPEEDTAIGVAKHPAAILEVPIEAVGLRELLLLLKEHTPHTKLVITIDKKFTPWICVILCFTFVQTMHQLVALPRSV